MNEELLNEVKTLLASFSTPEEFAVFQIGLEEVGKASLAGEEFSEGDLTPLAKGILAMSKDEVIEFYDAIAQLAMVAAHQAEMNQAQHSH